MKKAPLRIAVGAAQPLDRAALSAFIAQLPGLDVVSLQAIPPPAVLVWNVAPGFEGLDAPLPSGIHILYLVDAKSIPDVLPAASGVFSKDEAPESLGIAIRQVARGEQYLSSDLALALLQREVHPPKPPGFDPSSLTDREREMLDYISQGMSNKAIAARLYLSLRTVEGHLEKLYNRLGVHSRTEAMAIAFHHRSSR